MARTRAAWLAAALLLGTAGAGLAACGGGGNPACSERVVGSVRLAQATSVADLFASGNASYDRGDFAKSIADYSEAIRIQPTESAAFHNRAVAYLAQGEREKALADYGEAIRLDPK